MLPIAQNTLLGCSMGSQQQIEQDPVKRYGVPAASCIREVQISGQTGDIEAENFPRQWQ